MVTSTLKVKRFSSSDIFEIKKVRKPFKKNISLAWWLGYVIEKNKEEKTVSVNFLPLGDLFPPSNTQTGKTF